MVKVSIVVPVYNSSKTIDRCINSLLNQSYKNIEIVLVDDGSKDDSLKIIKKYKKDNKNVIAVHQENQGAGIARNTGIKKSSGDYVTFVDSDDELAEEAIEKMVNKLKKDTDVLVSGFKKIDSNGKIIMRRIPEDNLWTQFKYNSTVFKFYNLNYINKYNIRYSNNVLFEDMFFSFNAYSHTNNIEVYKNDLYIIHSNPHSITYDFKRKPLWPVNELLNNLYDLIDKEKYDKKMLEYYFLKIIILNVFVYIEGHSTSDINKMYITDYNWLKSKKINNKISFCWIKEESFLINLIINLFILFTKIKLNKFLIWLIKIAKFIRLE